MTARILIGCRKYGNIAPRDAGRHCLCAPCKRDALVRRQDWQKRNPSKAAEYTRAWIARNPEKRRAIEAAWKAANPDLVAQYNSTAGKSWVTKNPDKRTAICRRRAIAKMNRVPAWADRSAIDAVYAEARRLTSLTGIPHEVDHVLPLQGETVSGLHVADNLQVIPRSANRRKGNKL